MEFECQGCKDKCKISYPNCPTGCMYDDVDIPKDAKIWAPFGEEFKALQNRAQEIAKTLDTASKAE